MARSATNPPSMKSACLSERAQAVRELGRSGTPDDLSPLLQLALADKSAGVRLAAAAALADILSRHRLPTKDALVTAQSRQEMIRSLRSRDPATNTGLFQVLGALGSPEAIKGILVGLRDPRGDVRMGALVGLERAWCSGAANGDRAFLRELGATLASGRLRPEVCLEVSNLAASMGAVELLPALTALRHGLPGPLHGDMDEALARLDGRRGPDAFKGAWVGDGLDAGEVGAPPGSPTWFVFSPAIVLQGPPESLDVSRVSWSDGAGMELGDGGAPVPVRRLLARIGGGDAVEALQVGSATYRRPGDKDVLRLLDALEAAPELVEPGCADTLAGSVEEALSRRPTGTYARGRLALLCGRRDEAMERFLELSPTASLSAEAGWVVGSFMAGAGRRVEAEMWLRVYLEKKEKGRRAGARREEAGRLLEEIACVDQNVE